MVQVLGCAYSAMLEFGPSKLVISNKISMEPVTFSESGGVRYLHFSSELIQGAMRIRDPDEIYLSRGNEPPEAFCRLPIGS